MTYRQDGERLILALDGDWRAETGLRDTAAAETTLAAGGVRRVAFDAAGLGAWDAGLLVTLQRLRRAAQARDVGWDDAGLPEGVRKLLALAEAVPERAGARRGAASPSMLAGIGSMVMAAGRDLHTSLAFIGEALLGFLRLLVGRARWRRADFVLTLQECGPDALPIVSLIAALIGMVVAFVSSVQLKMFGAELYVANIVTLGMAMEMGALMTGIIMAGRTGASFAAQLGTMTVNEEIDALRTLGFSPVEYLVLPRMLALILLMPLLCLYADFMGILGGAVVGIFVFDLTPQQYFIQSKEMVTLSHFAQGLIKASVFGVIVAFTGCYRGLSCGRSAQAVGEATTSAVVTCITLIVVADSLLTLIYQATGF